MLKRFTVENFQSHANTVVDLSPGVNVVIGPSDSGKTALVRSLRWLFFNLPVGEEFRSTWGGDSRVEALFSDGKVYRAKTNSENIYGLNGEEFKAFGRGVPEPVSEFLNVSRINLLGQYDPPFMIGWTPGERGEFINRIANFEAIDRGIKVANQVLRTERSDIKSLKAELQRTEEDRAGLPDIEGMEEGLEALEEKSRQLQAAVSRKVDLADLVAELEKAAKGLDRFSTILSHEAPITRLLELEKQHEDLVALADDLEEVLHGAAQALVDITKYEERTKALEKELLEEFPDVCPLCGGEVDEKERHKILS